MYVVDQDRAKTFYTEKLGLEVREDAKLGISHERKSARSS
ncbi:MAG TPA: VOC family protein [Candidatus Krumholzibacteria bacterium]